MTSFRLSNNYYEDKNSNRYSRAFNKPTINTEKPNLQFSSQEYLVGSPTNIKKSVNSTIIRDHINKSKQKSNIFGDYFNNSKRDSKNNNSIFKFVRPIQKSSTIKDNLKSIFS